MKNKFIFTAILIFLLLSDVKAQIHIAQKFQYRTFTYNGLTIPYRLFVPENYNSANKYPLVLALHGSGERGSDNTRHVNNYRLATVWADSINQIKYPAFVLAPQCPSNGSWFSSFPVDRYPAAAETNVVIKILDSLMEEFSIDKSRLYVTGLSLGGYGTWDLIARYPDKFAAAIPMSGGGDLQSIPALLHIPIWNFHGRLDNAVPIIRSTELLDAFKTNGRDVLYTHCSPVNCDGMDESLIGQMISEGADLIHTEYQNGGHVIWDQSYDYKFLPDWVFKQYRIDNSVNFIDFTKGQKLSGDFTIKWNSAIAGGTVELYLSENAGKSWKLLKKDIPNTGSYLWNTSSGEDMAFGQLKILLRDNENVLRGNSNSEFFSVDNAGYGKPYVQILNGNFQINTEISENRFTIRFIAGSPEGRRSTVNFYYSPDGTKFLFIDSLEISGPSAEYEKLLDIEKFQNSKNAVLKIIMENVSDQTYSFIKESLRETVKAEYIEYISKFFDVPFYLNITDQSQLKGHEYRITFDDSSSSAVKYFSVFDMTESVYLYEKEAFLSGNESPVFNGLSFFAQDFVTKPDPGRSGWNKGASKKLNFSMSRFTLPSNMSFNGYTMPNDYRIVFYDSVADTSAADTLYPVTSTNIFPPRPVNFSIFNLSTGKKIDFAYSTSGTISTTHNIWFIEKLNNKRKRTWRITIVDTEPNRIIPSGDTLNLFTLKGLSVFDTIKVSSTLVNVTDLIPPAGFSLSQNFPNPFNPATTINFSLNEAGRAKLEVFNLLGERVICILDKVLEKGNYSVNFNGSSYSAGIYFYRLETKSKSVSRKMVLLK